MGEQLFNKAKELFKNKDYKNALSLFEESLNKEYYDSAYEIALFYLDYYRFLDLKHPDIKLAKYYLEIGADNGNKNCLFELYNLMFNFYKNDNDWWKALEYYFKNHTYKELFLKKDKIIQVLENCLIFEYETNLLKVNEMIRHLNILLDNCKCARINKYLREYICAIKVCYYSGEVIKKPSEKNKNRLVEYISNKSSYNYYQKFTAILPNNIIFFHNCKNSEQIIDVFLEVNGKDFDFSSVQKIILEYYSDQYYNFVNKWHSLCNEPVNVTQEKEKCLTTKFVEHSIFDRVEKQIVEVENKDLENKSVTRKLYVSNKPFEIFYNAHSIKDLSDEDGIIYYITKYYKKAIKEEHQGEKKYLDNYNAFIDGIKHRNYHRYSESAKFHIFIANFLKRFNGEWYICTAPGHEKSDNRSNGVYNILKNYVYLRKIFVLDNQILYRKSSVVKRTSIKGSRDEYYDEDIKTIGIGEHFNPKGKKIIIFDDITTSGGTLLACKQVLKDAGAESVICCAIGKTESENYGPQYFGI